MHSQKKNLSSMMFPWDPRGCDTEHRKWKKNTKKKKEMLTNNPVKESFYGRKKKLMFWQFFSFFIKVTLKLSKNGLWISIVSMTQQKYEEKKSLFLF